MKDNLIFKDEKELHSFMVENFYTDLEVDGEKIGYNGEIKLTLGDSKNNIRVVSYESIKNKIVKSKELK